MTKVFKNSGLKIYKIVGIAIFGLLLIWFTFNLTGLKFGNTAIVESCFIGEPIDFLFWGIYLACFIIFIFNDKIGKFVLGGYTFMWGAMQASIYFKGVDGVKGYNETFSQTHHLFGVSDTMIIKDTYHCILDILILAAFCYCIFYIILSIVKVRKAVKRTITQ